MPGYAAIELLPAQPRDLTDPDVWVRSGWRSRARREAAAHRNEMPAPSPRGLSLAALLALTGVPAAGVVSGALGGSGGAEAQAKPATASRGSGVSALQRMLGVSADGVFGPQTQKAVKAYQRSHGLTADGIAGPQTRSKLGMGAGPVLKRGGGARAGVSATRSVAARGGGVQALQRAIGVSADGVFGPQTESALKRWQGSHGLQADGIAGPLTRAKAGLGPGPVLKRKSARGSSGGGGDSRVAGVIAAANRIATSAVQVRRRPRLVQRLGLRLLGLGLLRAARRRPDQGADGVGWAHRLRRPRPGPADHGVRQRRPRLHGHRRAPVRHQRAQPDGQPLDLGVALERGLRGQAPGRPVELAPRTTPAASPPVPPARCTRATCAPRWWPGCVPARSARGSCCRIEDLDPQRSRREHEAAQLADLAAIGIDWDGQPVRQSERHELYADALARLEAQGRVYPCWCTRAEIREASQAPHGPLPEGAYPGTCRDLSSAERAEKERAADRPPALRLDARAERVAFTDLLHGEVEAAVDDITLRRWDGAYAYNLAVIVDDADQAIGEVVRGDDLLDTTPRQLLIARLLGLRAPRYGHVPLMLDADGKRLAKRDGPPPAGAELEHLRAGAEAIAARFLQAS